MVYPLLYAEAMNPFENINIKNLDLPEGFTYVGLSGTDFHDLKAFAKLLKDKNATVTMYEYDPIDAFNGISVSKLQYVKNFENTTKELGINANIVLDDIFFMSQEPDILVLDTCSISTLYKFKTRYKNSNLSSKYLITNCTWRHTKAGERLALFLNPEYKLVQRIVYPARGSLRGPRYLELWEK